ncbi:MAG: PD40 domain-containing protein [Lentisphaeria bacterium]|nr:PD40 domain-containing protein [Lentisphaeria bacterium]
MRCSFPGRLSLISVFTLIFCSLFLPLRTAFAQVTLSGSGVTGNPKLFYRGTGGPVSTKLRRTLWFSGWFDLVSDPKSAEYILEGKEGPDSLLLTVKNGADLEMFGISVKGKNDEAVYSAVDAVLNKLFGIDGICRSKIAFSAETGRGRKELYMCDIDGTNFKRITSNGSLNIEPSWHPSGRALLFNQYLTSSSPLVEYDILRNRSRVLSGQRGINSGKVSHSGRKIALVVTVGSQVDLFVRDYEGGGVVRLTNDRANEASPCWSPDDSRICFVSDRTGRPKLYIVSASGGKAERVKGTSGSECVAPAWSGDNKLAYTAKLGGYVLKVVDLAKGMGFPAAKNTDNSYISETLSVQGEGPSWAPDNRHIVLSSGGKIIVVDTRTGKSRVLVQGQSRCNGASWSPLLR